MKNILEYKGYYSRIEFDTESRVLYGKIEGINDLITFECESPAKIEEEFHNAVDEYLQFCKEVGKNPDKSYKGTFNIRISPDLHRKAAIKAATKNITLNKLVEHAIQVEVNN